MRKVAFHFHNDGIVNVNFSRIEEGNPGVGGTAFLAVLVPLLLSKREKLDIILLANQNGIFPRNLHVEVCKSLNGAIDYCRHNAVDVLVVDNKRLDLSTIKKYSDVNFILWANNFIPIHFLNKVSSVRNVVRIVNVSKEQNDLYRDMGVFNKSTYVNNVFPLSPILKYRYASVDVTLRDHKVVYVGSIVRLKGFHLLAKAWPIVLNEIPDAELYVIGTGKLYNRQEKLGKWGVATKKYERQFMKYLCKDSKILSSVHFMGEMGIEKYPLIAKCKVGVPNPSGLTETFGYTALEMQAMGCHVTTKLCPGYIDTVYEKNHLYKNTKHLAFEIIKLLCSNTVQSDNLVSWLQNNFECDVVAEQWEKVLNCEFNNKVIAKSLSSNDLNFHNKKLKEWIRLNIPDRFKKCLIPMECFYPSLIGIGYGRKVQNWMISKLRTFYKKIK